jgi:hypothetical protein
MSFIETAIERIAIDVKASKLVTKYGGLCFVKNSPDGVIVGYPYEGEKLFAPEDKQAVAFLQLNSVITEQAVVNHRETSVKYSLTLHYYISKSKDTRLKEKYYIAGLALTNYLKKLSGNGVIGLQIYSNVNMASGILPEKVDPICEYVKINFLIEDYLNSCDAIEAKIEELCC